MSRTLFTLLAVVALATCLGFAQEQPQQNPPGQSQPMPQTQPPPQPQQQQPAGHGQAGMSSQELQAAFESALKKNPELADVKVKVADDKIELSGTVDSQANKDKVRSTAEANADGRKVVDDDLKVSGGESKPPTPPPSAPPR